MSLRNIFTKKHYKLPEDDIVNDLIIPAMRVSNEVLIQSAYFSNQGLAQLAPGLTEIIQSNDTKLKLLISLKGISDKETLDTIQESSKLDQGYIEKLFIGLLTACEEDKLHNHARDCLSYLLATGKAELRLVGMNNKKAIWHIKAYIFKECQNNLTIAGSANCTHFGFTANGEVLTAELNPDEQFHTEEFYSTWNNNDNHSQTYIPSNDLIERIKNAAPESAPQSSNINELITQRILDEARIGSNQNYITRLNVPEYLNIEEGRYKHQGEALRKLKESNYSGMLSIATGGGKTKTSLVAATRIQNEKLNKNTAVLILAPTSTLTNMWEKEVKEFNGGPYMLSKMGSKKDRNRELQQLGLLLNQNNKEKRTIVLIATRQLFSSDQNISDFFKSLSTENTQTVLIGDEAHTLGSAGFQKMNPIYFEYKIGLSATPERAFDEEGSNYLDNFFGGEVFNFEIKDAISSKCLTPYKYHFHLCPQSAEEFEEFEMIQQKISKLQGMRSENDIDTEESLKSLYFKRTALISQTESKIEILNNLLDEIGSINKALFFASSGERNKNLNPGDDKQITMINRVLTKKSIHFHQITNKESADNQTANIQEQFKSGDYQAITAMKMLDEGVDLPMADLAFLIGSSKSEREWIQRRGRVLRNAPDKDFAIIHDFVTLPFGSTDMHSKWIEKSEMQRVTAFVEDSMNLHDVGEGWDAMDDYRERIRKNDH